MKVYVAGKDMDRARLVMDELKVHGHTITYDWVAKFSEGPTREKAIAEADAVETSDILVYLWEPNQESARYEAGMAMGLKKKIIVSGKTDGFFFQLPNVTCLESDQCIIDHIQRMNETRSLTP